MPSLLAKAEDSLTHLRLRIVAVREFVRLLAGVPTRMKYRSPYVRVRLWVDLPLYPTPDAEGVRMLIEAITKVST